jgi:hypothetical protein
MGSRDTQSVSKIFHEIPFHGGMIDIYVEIVCHIDETSIAIDPPYRFETHRQAVIDDVVLTAVGITTKRGNYHEIHEDRIGNLSIKNANRIHDLVDDDACQVAASESLFQLV